MILTVTENNLKTATVDLEFPIINFIASVSWLNLHWHRKILLTRSRTKISIKMYEGQKEDSKLDCWPCLVPKHNWSTVYVSPVILLKDFQIDSNIPLNQALPDRYSCQVPVRHRLMTVCPIVFDLSWLKAWGCQKFIMRKDSELL